MDRRTLLAAGIAAPVALSLPALAIPHGITNSRYIGVVQEWLAQHYGERKPVSLAGESYIDDFLSLRDSDFTVRPYGKIFSIQGGWQDDPDGLEIVIRERGVELPPLRIGSTYGLGLSEHDSRRDKYFVRRMRMVWDDPRREALKDQIEPDLSAFKVAMNRIRAEQREIFSRYASVI